MTKEVPVTGTCPGRIQTARTVVEHLSKPGGQSGAKRKHKDLSCWASQLRSLAADWDMRDTYMGGEARPTIWVRPKQATLALQHHHSDFERSLIMSASDQCQRLLGPVGSSKLIQGHFLLRGLGRRVLCGPDSPMDGR